jgi:hypothetical protein
MGFARPHLGLRCPAGKPFQAADDCACCSAGCSRDRKWRSRKSVWWCLQLHRRPGDAQTQSQGGLMGGFRGAAAAVRAERTWRHYPFLDRIGPKTDRLRPQLHQALGPETVNNLLADGRRCARRSAERIGASSPKRFRSADAGKAVCPTRRRWRTGKIKGCRERCAVRRDVASASVAEPLSGEAV